jgi:hypothetical protein
MSVAAHASETRPVLASTAMNWRCLSLLRPSARCLRGRSESRSSSKRLRTIAVVERLQDLLRDYRGRFQTARRSALMLRIIDLAFERPVRSISDFAEAL